MTATLADMITTIEELTDTLGRFSKKINYATKNDPSAEPSLFKESHNSNDVDKDGQDMFVRLVLSGEKSVQEVARMVGKTDRTVRRWKDNYQRRLGQKKN